MKDKPETMTRDYVADNLTSQDKLEFKNICRNCCKKEVCYLAKSGIINCAYFLSKKDLKKLRVDNL